MRKKPQFSALPREEEAELLSNDDEKSSRGIAYLLPLIDRILERVDASDRKMARAALISVVPIAIKRFLQKKEMDKGYSLATYFTWYIHQFFEVLGKEKGRNIPPEADAA
jgi:hypothetical protein